MNKNDFTCRDCFLFCSANFNIHYTEYSSTSVHIYGYSLIPIFPMPLSHEDGLTFALTDIIQQEIISEASNTSQIYFKVLSLERNLQYLDKKENC